ncbi:MAG: phage holin family protein [Candidatus Yonathbacteria bacterium]|nr:phage holin family protein [Candidatus Yonathbacteria bacterium]
MKLIAKWIIVALTILALPSFVPGITITSFGTALLVAAFFGILNTVVRPLILLVAFPITLITFGLFSFVVNALLFWGVGSFVKGFEVAGFVPALIGSLVVSAVSSVMHVIFSKE